MRRAGRYIATIDCGTSNVRCIVFDMDTGRQVSSASQDWYVPNNAEIAGAYDFDAESNWELVCRCTRAALSGLDSSAVAAVTSSGFRHGIFCLDKAGNALYGCFNMDSRMSTRFIDENGLGALIHRKAGDWPSLHGLPRLMWIKENDPAAFERIDKVLCVSDWVVYKLCGQAAVEPGNASSTLALDIETRSWSEEIIGRCGLPRHIFPRLADAGEIMGAIGAEMAQATGFSPGTLVAMGAADTQAGLVGVGSTGVGSAAIVGGTYWLDCLVTDKPYTDPQYNTRMSCHSERGQWIYEGVGFYVGLTVRWFRDVFGEREKELARAGGGDAYDILTRLTLDVPAGSYGMQVLFSDVANQSRWRMCAPTFMGWDVLDPGKSHRGVFLKAILENACYQAYGEYENIRRITGDASLPDKLILCGGAARSAPWRQILSDCMGVPVETPVEKEGTAIGAAIFAAVGAGLYPDTGTAVSALVRTEARCEPNMANHAVYANEYRRWRELYRRGLELVDDALVKSMWQSPSTISEAQRQNPWRI
ncbi:MAG: FGGY family carbohydrate kinase [Clostridia bacterium]|nr:FGGY family carbohydrate kinase [Clostridia bacterium]